MFKIAVGEYSRMLLPEITVGKHSFFRAAIVGCPEDFNDVRIVFEVPSSDCRYVEECISHPGGEWMVEADGANFPVVGCTCYHVMARFDGKGDVYLGGGILRIVESMLPLDQSDIPGVSGGIGGTP